MFIAFFLFHFHDKRTHAKKLHASRSASASAEPEAPAGIGRCARSYCNVQIWGDRIGEYPSNMQ
jgi:hypothetical protein